jgi:hypothetical protein
MWDVKRRARHRRAAALEIYTARDAPPQLRAHEKGRRAMAAPRTSIVPPLGRERRRADVR